MLHRHPAVEVGIVRLLKGQLDVAAHTATAHILRAAVCRLHDARAAARHHREAHFGKRRAHLARQLVVAVIFIKARAAKHRRARPHEMQRAETAQKVADHAHEQAELLPAWIRPVQQRAVHQLRAEGIVLDDFLGRRGLHCRSAECFHGIIFAVFEFGSSHVGCVWKNRAPQCANCSRKLRGGGRYGQ